MYRTQIWTEVQSGERAVNFITGSGGFLQALVNGYAGLRINPTDVTFLNIVQGIPDSSDSLTLKGFTYLGTKMTVTFTLEEVQILCTKAGDIALTLETGGEAKDFNCGTKISGMPFTIYTGTTASTLIFRQP